MVRRFPPTHVRPNLGDQRQRSRSFDAIDTRQIDARELVQLGPGIEAHLIALGGLARLGGGRGGSSVTCSRLAKYWSMRASQAAICAW